MEKKSDPRKIFDSIRKMPLLSASAARLLQLCANPDHDLGDIIKVVKYDAPLTVHVLRVVNSSAFGLLNPITSIDRAVSYLGERMVVGIALGDSAPQLFDKNLGGYDGRRGDLWRHDLCTAIAAREVAKLAGGGISPELAFTGGIMHDIGKAIVSDFLTGMVASLLDEIERRQVVDYLAGEQAALGTDHAEIGAELARYWGLPEPLLQVIHHHHRPMEASPEYQGLAYAVHLGDIIAMMGGFGTGADNLNYQLDSGYQRHIPVTQESLAGILMITEEEFRKIDQAFGNAKEG